MQQILFAISAKNIWHCCNYLLLQFYDAKIYVSVCRVCKLKLHIWLQKLAAIIDCNNCIQSATGHVTLVKVAVLATKTFTVYRIWVLKYKSWFLRKKLCDHGIKLRIKYQFSTMVTKLLIKKSWFVFQNPESVLLKRDIPNSVP